MPKNIIQTLDAIRIFSRVWMLCHTNQLSHGSHGTIDAPGTRFIGHHGNHSQHRRGKHYPVKPKGKLSSPRGKPCTVVGKMPRQPKGPQQGNSFSQGLASCKHQVGIPDHETEHGQEEGQKSIAKQATFHPLWYILVSGKL